MSHIVWHDEHPTVMVGVKCKGCGALIRGQIVDDRLRETSEINGKIVIRERLVMANLPTYAEIQFELHNGTKFTTCACQHCAESATPDQLQAWFEQDLDAMDDEDVRHRVKSDRAEAFKAQMRGCCVKDSAKHKEKDARELHTHEPGHRDGPDRVDL